MSRPRDFHSDTVERFVAASAARDAEAQSRVLVEAVDDSAAKRARPPDAHVRALAKKGVKTPPSEVICTALAAYLPGHLARRVAHVRSGWLVLPS